MFSNKPSASPQVMSQHVGDRLVAVADGERVRVVALAAAHVSHSTHTSGRKCISMQRWPGALALVAAAAGHVEAEPPRLVAAELRLGQLGEQLADQVEHAGVGRRVRHRRVAQSRLDRPGSPC